MSNWNSRARLGVTMGLMSILISAVATFPAAAQALPTNGPRDLDVLVKEALAGRPAVGVTVEKLDGSFAIVHDFSI